MQIIGTVQRGSGEAKRLFNLPTANLPFPVGRFLAYGTYLAVIETGGQRHDGLAYYGANDPLKLEVHLLDFSGDLYGIELTLELGEKISDYIPFKSVEQMKKKIDDDVRRARIILTRSSAA